ncbi:2-hydroxyacid dehydrogenase [Leucobacter salsicius]|uniref:2-hydroxyacid dehydrogenase n=1 Tax=Leucobacter salsicius TaxID=664638 RepID=UPI0003472A5C|nr:2-hydroxyacid dehydrogenase [Leucobacter salsicius]
MSHIVVSLPSDPGLLEAMQEALGDTPGVRLVEWDLKTPAPEPTIDLVVPPYWGGERRLANLAGVTTRLVQWQSIGYNGVGRYLPEGLPFANAATVHEPSTAELALALTLASQRGIDTFVRQADARTWDLRPYPSLADRRVMILGYGGVGKAIDARLQGFEVAVTRIARSARQETGPLGMPVPVHALSELTERLSDTEIVIIGVPLTPETRGLVGAKELAALPDGALVVNVARGPVVDTEALMAELNSGRLRAALDVTDPEPLPEDHPLWDCPNLIVTPHAGGDSSAMMPRMTALIRRQISRLMANESPENLIDLAR